MAKPLHLPISPGNTRLAVSQRKLTKCDQPTNLLQAGLSHSQVPMPIVEKVEPVMWPCHAIGVPLLQVDIQNVPNLGSFLVVAHLCMDGSMNLTSVVPNVLHDVYLPAHRPISKFIVCWQHPSSCQVPRPDRGRSRTSMRPYCQSAFPLVVSREDV